MSDAVTPDMASRPQMTASKSTVTVLIDEAGDGTPGSPMVVGGAAVADFSTLEKSISGLYSKIAANDVVFGNMKGFQEFQGKGFHKCKDPSEIKDALYDLLNYYPGINTFAIASCAVPHPESKAFVIASIARILEQILLRYHRSHEVIAIIEESSSYNEIDRRQIQDRAVENARWRNPTKHLPLLDVHYGQKKNPHSLAVTDYIIGAIHDILALWNKAIDESPGSETIGLAAFNDPSRYHARRFNQVKASVSWIELDGYGTVWNRKYGLGVPKQ